RNRSRLAAGGHHAGTTDGCRCRLPAQSAGAAVGVHPVLLYQEILAAEVHVGCGPVGGRVRGAEIPGTLVGVLVAVAVVPGVEILVGVGLFGLVRQGVDLGVGGRVVVGRPAQGVAVEKVDVVRRSEEHT